MTNKVIGELLEDRALSLEELARACAVEPDWVVQHVQTGVLLQNGPPAGQLTAWRFTSLDLVRARTCTRSNPCSTPTRTWPRWWSTCRKKWRACGGACTCWASSRL